MLFCLFTCREISAPRWRLRLHVMLGLHVTLLLLLCRANHSIGEPTVHFFLHRCAATACCAQTLGQLRRVQLQHHVRRTFLVLKDRWRCTDIHTAFMAIVCMKSAFAHDLPLLSFGADSLSAAPWKLVLSRLVAVRLERLQQHLRRLQVELVLVGAAASLRSALPRLGLVLELLLLEGVLRRRLGQLLLVGSVDDGLLSAALALLLVRVERAFDEVRALLATRERALARSFERLLQGSLPRAQLRKVALVGVARVGNRDLQRGEIIILLLRHLVARRHLNCRN